ncbi:heme oxygenase-like protein, partial [Dissophora ornata]
MASSNAAAAESTGAAGAQKTPLLLTDELRQKTKGLHGKMDRLVQLGLFTILDYQIYRQILLGFYYIFKTYEEECEKHLKSSKVHPWVLHSYSPELWRTQAFEADLAYFYGSDWKQHVIPSKPAQAYM